MWPNGAFDIVLDRMFLLRRSSSAVYTTNCSETSRQFRIWMDVNRNKSYRKIEVLVRKEPSQSRDIVWGSRIQVHCCSSWYCVLYVDGFLHSTSGPPSSNIPWLPPSLSQVGCLVFTWTTMPFSVCVSFPYSIPEFCQSLLRGSTFLSNVCHTGILAGYLIYHSLLLQWDGLLHLYKAFPQNCSWFEDWLIPTAEDCRLSQSSY